MERVVGVKVMQLEFTIRLIPSLQKSLSYLR